jgi:hypothetical protein
MICIHSTALDSLIDIVTSILCHHVHVDSLFRCGCQGLAAPAYAGALCVSRCCPGVWRLLAASLARGLARARGLSRAAPAAVGAPRGRLLRELCLGAQLWPLGPPLAGRAAFSAVPLAARRTLTAGDRRPERPEGAAAGPVTGHFCQLHLLRTAYLTPALQGNKVEQAIGEAKEACDGGTGPPARRGACAGASASLPHPLQAPPPSALPRGTWWRRFPPPSHTRRPRRRCVTRLDPLGGTTLETLSAHGCPVSFLTVPSLL